MLGVLAVVGLLALTGCAYTYPGVCDVCGYEFEEAALANGVSVSIVESDLHIHLQADGSAQWEARVVVEGDDTDELRTNAALREAVVRQAFEWHTGPAPDEPENLSTAMDDDTLYVSFDDPEFAEPQPGGVLLADGLYERDAVLGGEDGAYRVRTDEVILHPPDGWTVLNDPEDATVTDDTVTWVEWVDTRTYVVLGPDQSTSTVAAGEAAIVRKEASWAVPSIIASSVFPTLFLGGVALAFLSVVERTKPGKLRSRVDGELVGALVVTVFGLVPAGFFALLIFLAGGSGSSFQGVLAGFTVASAGLFGVAGAVSNRRPSIWWSPAVMAVGLGVMLSVFFALGFNFSGPLFDLLFILVMSAWSLITAGLGALAFGLGRWWANSR